MASIFETNRPQVTKPALPSNVSTSGMGLSQLAAAGITGGGRRGDTAPTIGGSSGSIPSPNQSNLPANAQVSTSGLFSTKPAIPAAPPIGSAAAAPASGFDGPANVSTYAPGSLIGQQYRQSQPQMQATQQLGANIQGQGAQVANQQAAQAGAYNQVGQGFNATSQSVAPQFGVGEQLSMKGGTAAPAALKTSQIGAAPSIGQISNVAGQLGNTPQAAGVGGIAGQLGAGPQVGQVGNIQMGAGPGAVMPQLGNMGQQSGDQQAMMGRLNSFLDSPEGPSVAESQLQSAQADNMANLLGAARSGRGGAGAQAQALRGAMSEGSAIMSDTAGQLATLRAQEADMLKNRQLSAIGLGGDMSTAARGQDLSFRGQDLSALQGDQSTDLGARGQDLQSAMANQSTQTALEQLRAQTDLGARGQNLAALQGDQGTAAQMSLGQLQADMAGRGQNLSALQGDQSTALGREGLAAQTALGARGQDLSLLQGNQSTALGARGQDVTRELGLQNVNLGMRGQDAGVLMGDADRNLAAQRLGLDAGLGYGNLANQANQIGLNHLSQANQQGVMAQGMQNDLLQSQLQNQTSLVNQERAAQAGIQQQGMINAAQPSFGESLAIATLQGISDERAKTNISPIDSEKPPSEDSGLTFSDILDRVGKQSLMRKGLEVGISGLAALSDEKAKTKKETSSLDDIAEHLRSAPGYRYRYKPGVGEDPSVEHAGPMAQDLERGPFGDSLVNEDQRGLKHVDTAKLTLVNHAALASMRSELDKLKAQLNQEA